MEQLIHSICQKEGLPCRDIQVLQGGQVNQVFLIDGAHVVRIGSRVDALSRLKYETDLMQSLANTLPVPKITAFGEQDGYVYQIQQYIRGQKLYSIWRNLQPDEQENIAAELASYLKILHSANFPNFGYARQDTSTYTTWADFLWDQFQHTLAEIQALAIRMEPGYIEMAEDYLKENQSVLQDGFPTLVHGDLQLTNILVNNGKISAILDFEWALHAPLDYELWVIEAFCLYPNDQAEDEHEVYCAADFANFLPLLRKHYPALFEIPHLRERLNIYQIDSTLSSYLAWRKAHLNTIPPDRMAAKDFYTARITNFTSRHGIRLVL